MSIDGDRAIVASANMNSAYVFFLSDGVWTEEAQLVASGATEESRFGVSASLDGDRAIVGAESDDTDAGKITGAAYIFVRSGTEWIEEAKLSASDGSSGDDFGISVSLDGNRALVGASNASSRGAAYVFSRSGGIWTEDAKLVASTPDFSDNLGNSVSLDGDYALVGSPNSNTKDALSAGSAYIFTRSTGVWLEEARLTASDAAFGDFFSISVSLEGNRALLGASSDTAGGENAGSAYVFVRSGGSWSEETILVASDGAAFDGFGSSVSLLENRALIGASGDDDGGSGAGSAYTFIRSGDVWTEEAKLTASDAAAGDQFGFSVSLDGDRALIGSPSDDPPDLSTGDTGAAYVFGSMPVAVEGAPASQRFRLDNPFPNPARRQVTVRYKLGEAVEVRLGIYDVLGREVDVLAAGPQAAGSHEAQLSSGHLPAGLYVLRLMAGQEQMTQRVLIVK